MKKFTHALPVLLSLVVFHIPTVSAAEKMRDMSLSVEDTNRQIAIPQTVRGNPADPGFYNDNNHNGGYNSSYNDYEDSNGYINNSGNFNFDANTPISPNMANNVANQLDNDNQPNNMIGGRVPPPIRGGNQGFINHFCSTNYSPKNISSEAQKSCMDTQREEACDRFQHAMALMQTGWICSSNIGRMKTHHTQSFSCPIWF